MNFITRFLIFILLLAVAALGCAGLWTEWFNMRATNPVSGKQYYVSRYGLLQTCTMKQTTYLKSIWDSKIVDIQSKITYKCMDNLSSDKQIQNRLANGLLKLESWFKGKNSDLNSMQGYLYSQWGGLAGMLLGALLAVIGAGLLLSPRTARHGVRMILVAALVYCVGCGMAAFGSIERAKVTTAGSIIQSIANLGSGSIPVPGWGMITSILAGVLLLVIGIAFVIIRKRFEPEEEMEKRYSNGGDYSNNFV